MNSHRTTGGDLASSLKLEVEALMRRVATTVVMPRFRQLIEGEIREKSPGEIVTIADHQAEEALANGLVELLPGSRFVGEEGSAADPSVLSGMDDGLVWIVDPLDGTAHFAAGREPFGTMVALAADGVLIGGWIYNPVPKRMFNAELGKGAFVSDQSGSTSRLRTIDPPGVPVAGLATQFMTPELREATTARGAEAFDLVPIPRCAAEHYPRLCRGENHIALFQRTLPWDHAAGALLLSEAGGHVARWDGTPYRFHDDGLGILAATSRDLWTKAAEVLLADASLQANGRQMHPATTG